MKKVLIGAIIALLALLALGVVGVVGGSAKKSQLHGFYQSTATEGYHIQMSFDKSDKSFTQYIDNREVNKGIYESLDTNTYKVNGDAQSFEIILEEDNSFNITINKINNGDNIKMHYVNNTPTYFENKFNDVDEYKKLLNP